MQYTSRYNPSLRPIARQLRNNPTRYEKILWSKLRKKQILNVLFYRQVSIGNYILDFYAKTIKLAIEVDGDYHLNTEIQSKDSNRDNYLASLGILVLRVSNEEVLNEMNKIITRIKEIILNVLGSHPPSSSKEGGLRSKPGGRC